MVLYKCDICYKQFRDKYDLSRHKNRKFSCSKTIPVHTEIYQQKCKTVYELNNNSNLDRTDNCEKVKHVCNWCNNSFSQKSSLNRHLKSRCKVKKNNDKEKEDIYIKLLEENKKLVKKVKNLEKNKQIINNNTINNTTNNIKLVSFGDEDLDTIPQDIIKQVLNYGFKSVPIFTKYLHFNKNKPENHNIYISNLKNKLIMVYKKNDWNLTDQDDILGKLIDFKTDFLAEKFDKYKDDLPDSTLRKFDRFLDEQYDDDVINDIKEELKLLLYNNRKLPLNTKKQLE